MEISQQQITLNCPEPDVYNRLLTLDNKHILELGCGSAEITRNIACGGVGRRVTAFEVDAIAHDKNLRLIGLDNVTFGLAGAEDIPLADATVDVVFMFKSLHHVPLAQMDQALAEIRRVLKTGGLAYISEPVYAGAFNDILRLFHDEQQVRQAAFNAVKKAVDNGVMLLIEECFFNSPMVFADFDDFETRILQVTHTQHTINNELYQRIKQSFEEHMGDDGAYFQMPIRVDLLQTPDY